MEKAKTEKKPKMSERVVNIEKQLAEIKNKLLKVCNANGLSLSSMSSEVARTDAQYLKRFLIKKAKSENEYLVMIRSEFYPEVDIQIVYIATKNTNLIKSVDMSIVNCRLEQVLISLSRPFMELGIASEMFETIIKDAHNFIMNKYQTEL